MNDYKKKLKDPRWQQVRLEIMNRDRWRCRECHCSDETLSIHHIYYGGLEPWEAPKCTMLTLCLLCHKNRQEIERLMFWKFAAYLAQMSIPQLEVQPINTFFDLPK